MTTSVLDTEWERHRSAVFGVAYRLLGGVADAEDIVQDVWLQASAADLSAVRDLRAWLVTVAARLSYNVLSSARARRERYVGPWLPEPLLTGPDIADSLLMDESVQTAMLVVMDELEPAERVAFVLHDVFSIPFAEIADLLVRSQPATRQLASRARRKLAAVSERPRSSREEQQRVLTAFRLAARAGDLEGLVRVLDPDVVYVSDGGGRVSAARIPVRGADRVAKILARVARQPALSIEPVEIGGGPALAVYRAGALWSIDSLEIVGGRITSIWRVVNPEKLRHLGHN
ncbi:RNA polymerase sigma factor SigJ [Nocardia transvalensis]|uniref:RNA polymerase sigma factor SigJ n=1 Tax=Nocardia transvalensis TaxID=37333 RepID=UPI0018956012|nr:RNA polymerase sigma factor SigJ [Nocardia transvalensis]MBF6332726.1 RNA polymerase sigma factor SigJ [Nocardia transvalensis]